MIRRARLVTGLVLFAFVATHLANHALGVISLQAMEDGRGWFLAVWRNPAGTVAVAGSLVVHMALAAWSLYCRRSLRMPAGEWLQLALGFAIPALLMQHLIGTRAAHEMFGTADTYALVLLAHWKLVPGSVWLQTAGLYAAWIHGCLGLWFWLRLKPGFPAWQPVAFALAVLVPVVSWLGYYAGGREVLALAEDPEWVRAALRDFGVPGAAGRARLDGLELGLRLLVAGLVAAALLGRLVRPVLERRRGLLTVTYPDGRAARVAAGASVLDASRQGGVPHASVCGGRGRCSTCRVRIVDGLERLPEPSPEEERVLKRVGAPPRVRLACQAIPRGDVSVVPLLAPGASVRDARRPAAGRVWQEREVVVLFADLRAFTRFSERKLPYDVVFVLNRYFASMGQAVEEAGGHLDKFIGDGVMALFGIRGDPGEGARQALRAARLMSEKLADLNVQLEHELDSPLRIGIGVHAGPAILGDMGYGSATGLTAIGDTVNTASRLETMTKEFGVQLVFSQTVAASSAVDTGGLSAREVAIRGRDDPLAVYAIGDASELDVPA